MALVLTPAPTIRAWLDSLDEQISRSPGFFDDRAVILDVAMLPPDEPDLAGLLPALTQRGINVVGTEGAHPSWTGFGVPSLPVSTRPSRPFVVPDAPPPAASPAAAATAVPAEIGSLLLDRAVRSGQTVSFDQGDVTVVGPVASGAEIIASGSIHIYGPLRGRAVAGVSGNTQARIFCARMEAELVAIGGIYLTADQVPKAFRGRPVQVMLDQQALLLSPLD